VKYDRTVSPTRLRHRHRRGDPCGETFKKSQNNYDWLGEGIYFWSSVRTAHQFADSKGDGQVKTPAVVGAILQIGECFDLMDTRFTRDLAKAYSVFKKVKSVS